MYDEMMTSLLRVILLPAPQGGGEGENGDSAHMGSWEYTTPVVSSQLDETAPTNSGWKNLLKWRAFTRKNRERILAEFA